MNIVIRVDSSLEIGTGHIMRCTTLAKHLMKYDATVYFICRQLYGHSLRYLNEQGFKVFMLDSIEEKVFESEIEWHLKNWEKDALETYRVIQSLNQKIDLLIVDHYGIDSRWESSLRSSTKKIMVIDDLANRPHDCDILLDQNYYLNMNKRYQNLLPNHCIQLLGPNYLILRDEFLNALSKEIKRKTCVNRILIFFGGTDPTGETIKTLRAIKEANLQHVEFDVIVGINNKKNRLIEDLCKEMGNVSFHCQVNNMAEFMIKAELAIGAGGSTTWERCILRLPSLTIIVADNQLEVTEGLAYQGATINLGKSDEVSVETIKRNLFNVLNNRVAMKKMIDACSIIINHEEIKKQSLVNIILEKLNEHPR